MQYPCDPISAEEYGGYGEQMVRQEEHVLLYRMEKYSHNHLLFLHNFSVIFDDNISERDLRKVKTDRNIWRVS